MAGGTIALLVAYIVGVPVAAYVLGRVDGREMAPLAILWPILLPLAIVFVPLWFLGRLGERHR
jgi:hypothetical protein